MAASTDPTPPGGQYELPDYVTVIGHSNLFYWWPVWVVAFALAGLTYMGGDTMAVVPAGTEAVPAVQVPGFEGPRDVLIAPEGATLPAADGPAGDMRVMRSNNPGVIFAATLLFVAVASTITLRGLVSVIVVILLILAVVALAYFNVWDDVLNFLGGLDIRINGTGYLAIAVPLFLVWAFVVLVYDRQHYVIFDQGQVRVVREVGDGETVMDVHGASVEKKRADVFRHWLLGLGSGDLVIKAAGHVFEIENVLNINRKLAQVHRMLQERQVSAVVAAPMAG